MTTYRASWIVPIAGPPLRDGWVSTEGGRIVGVGGGGPDAGPAVDVDLGDVAVMPALVNAHTHLELSWLRGRVQPRDTFIDWVSSLMAQRPSPSVNTGVDADRDGLRQGMAAALAEMKASGTGVAGDVSNSLAGLDLLAASGLGGVMFHEILRFNVGDAAEFVTRAQERVAAAQIGFPWQVALAPHAPYSVSTATFAAIRATREPDRWVPTAVHVGESQEEMEMLRSGGGPWRAMLESMGAWNPGWVAPGCGPVEYLDRLDFWDARALAVHGVHLSDPELATLARRRATLVTCPRSNAWVGAGVPPVQRFFDSGVRVAVGTDSLASVADLNLFAELAELRRLAPGVPAGHWLACATRNGADALGLGDDYGTIAPGKRAAFIAVEIPAGTVDVEQYLVSGIGPESVHWVEPLSPC